jgi:hypothetical protein
MDNVCGLKARGMAMARITLRQAQPRQIGASEGVEVKSVLVRCSRRLLRRARFKYFSILEGFAVISYENPAEGYIQSISRQLKLYQCVRCFQQAQIEPI